ncbi:hypothetical protein R6Q57_030163 [Mikania cordata]
MGHNLETRSLLDEPKTFDRIGGLFDLGHPLLNRMAECFVKAAGIGAVQAVSREAYFTAMDGGDSTSIPPEITTGQKKHRFSELRVKRVMLAYNFKFGLVVGPNVLTRVKSTGKESIQWGKHDINSIEIVIVLEIYTKNSAMAGAITGAALALTFDDSSHEDIVQGAITGAAISTAANLLTGIF